METIIENTIFHELDIPADAEIIIRDKVLFVTKWNWDFQANLLFQKQAQKLIQKNRDHKVYIFCNHPHCFTLGRGNERGVDNLVAFNEDLISSLKFPVHKIHRGGGITFHFPGQWIFYPICAINNNYTLEDHMCWLLKSTRLVLEKEFINEKLMATKKLMGVWHKREKLASIGVGINRFVTEHGLALNLKFDKEMKEELVKINPCGMDSQVYTSVDDLTSKKYDEIREKFHQAFIHNLQEDTL